MPTPWGEIWALSALGLWVQALVRLARGERRPGALVGRWWAASLVAPVVLAVVVGTWWSTRGRAAPESTGDTTETPEAPPMSDPITARLDEAERAIHALADELRAIRALVGAAPASAPTPAAAPPAPPPKAAVAAAAATRSAPPPAPPRPRPEPSRRPTRTASDLLDARALAWAGGVVTLLGVVFLFVLAVNRGWIGPAERVLAGALASALLVGAGVVARRRYGQLEAALAAVGAGLAGWYVTLLAATARYDLVDQGAALVVAAAIAAVGTALALAWSAQILAGIGLVGAALAPAAVAIDTGIEVLGTAFAALVFAAIAAVGLRRDWTWLLVAGIAATAPQWAALLVVERDEPAGGAVAVAVLLVGLYLATAVARALSVRRLDAVSSTLVPLSASLGVASVAALLDDRGVWLLVLALPFAALAAVLFGRTRDLSALLAAAAMVVSALGFADLLGGLGLTVAWALQASALAWLAGRVGEPRFAAASLAYLGLAIGHALAFEAPPTDLYTAGSDPAAGIPALLVVAGAAALVAWWARRWTAPEGGGELARLFADLVGVRSWWAAGAAAAAGLAVVDAASAATLALVEAAGVEPAFDWGRVAVVCLWSALGAALYAGGTWVRSRALAVAGVVWLAVTGIDVIAFDLNELGRTEAGWAAVAVAAGLLAGAYGAELARRRRPLASLYAIAAVVASSGFAAVAVGRILEGDRAHGLAALGLAALYAALAAGVFGREGRRDTSTSLWAVAAAAALVAELLLLDGTAFVAAAAALAVAFGALMRATGERRFAVAALGPLVLAVLVTMVELAPPSDFFVANETPGDGALAVAIVAAALAALAGLVRVPERAPEDELDRVVDETLTHVPGILAWLAAATGVYAGSLAILGLVLGAGSADVTTEFQRGHTAVSAFWGLVALLTLYAGLRRGAQPLRLAGFALFGAALVKLFLYDLSALNSVTRALSFLAVGAVLLLAGFFYQRLAGPRGGGPRPA